MPEYLIRMIQDEAKLNMLHGILLTQGDESGKCMVRFVDALVAGGCPVDVVINALLKYGMEMKGKVDKTC